MKTQSAIEKRIEKRMWNDATGYEWTMYIGFLDYERAKKFVTNMPFDQWQKEHNYVTSKPVQELMLDYIQAAVLKLDNPETHQNRMLKIMQHCVAWFWLMDDTAFSDRVAKYVYSTEVYSMDMLDEIIIRAGGEE